MEKALLEIYLGGVSGRCMEHIIEALFLGFAFDIFSAFDSGISDFFCIFWNDPMASRLLCARNAVLIAENTYMPVETPYFYTAFKIDKYFIFTSPLC